MTATLQPLYLLADSQLLFWTDAHGRSPLLDALAQRGTAATAAYVGASNGDAPEYYEIFTAAMARVGIIDCRMIRAAFAPEDERFLARADIVLLAGGDVERGWRTMGATGLRDRVVQRYRAGATVIGISAGAVQLGLYGASEQPGASLTPFATFQLCPFVVGAHDERSEWRALTDLVRALEGTARGIGLRSGAGLMAHGDGTIEAIRHPADEVVWKDGAIVRRTIATRAATA